jgi:multidrug resistance protein
MKNTRTPLIILAISLFIDLLGFGLVIPLLPVYILHFGGASWIGGVLLASFSLMQFIFSPIWGRVSDRHGRRPVILVGLVGSACAFLAFGLARSLAMLFIARVASGILTSASLPTSQAYIADVTPPEKRAGGMAVLGAAFGLGFAFGPVIGGVLSTHPMFGITPLAMPALFAALLSGLNFCFAFFKLPESHTERNTDHGGKSVLAVFPDIVTALKNPAIGAQLLVFAVSTFAFTAVESSFSWLVLYRFDHLLHHVASQSFHLKHPGVPLSSLSLSQQREWFDRAQTAATSRIFGIVGITMLFTQGAVMGGVASRIGENRLVMFGAALQTLTLFGIAVAPSLAMIYILSAFLSLATGVMNPALSALITHAAGPQERGMLSGAQQGLGSMARIIAPPINNYLVGIQTGIPFFISSVFMAVAFVFSLRLKPLPAGARPRRGRRGDADTPADAEEQLSPLH